MDDIDNYLNQHKDILSSPDEDINSYITKNTPKTAGQRVAGAAKDVGSYVGKHAKDTVADVGQSALDFSTGAANGATLGTLPQIAGGLDVGIQAAQGGLHNLAQSLPDVVGKYIDPGENVEQYAARGIKEGFVDPNSKLSRLASYSNQYADSRDESKGDLAKVADRSPWLYNAGQLAGGMVTGKVVGGATEAAMGLPKAATMLGRAGRAATIAAPEGAFYGAANSNANLIGDKNNDPTQVGIDALKGAAIASPLAAGASLAMDAGPMIAKKVKDFASDKADNYINSKEYLRAMKKGYDFGNDGVNINNELTQEGRNPDLPGVNLNKITRDNATDLTNRIMQTNKQLGQEMQGALQDATNKGITVDIGNAVDKHKNMLYTLENDNAFLSQHPTVATLMDKFKQTRYPEFKITPMEAKTVTDELNQTINGLSGATNLHDQMMFRSLKVLRDDIGGALNTSVPQYGQAVSKFKSFRDAVPDVILAKGKDPDMVNKAFGPLDTQKLSGNLENILETGSRPGVQAVKGKNALSDLEESLTDLGNNNPDVLNKFLNNPNKTVINPNKATPSQGQIGDFMDNLRDQADTANMMYRMRRQNPQQGSLSKLKDTLLGKDVNINAANKVGLANKAVSDKVGGAVDAFSNANSKYGSQIYNMANNKLMGIAQKLGVDQQLGHMGKALGEAIQNGDLPKKNAALFAILQNPRAREIINSSEDENP